MMNKLFDYLPTATHDDAPWQPIGDGLTKSKLPVHRTI